MQIAVKRMMEKGVKPEIEIFDAGMEDNIYYRRGELAGSNAQFVERIVRISQNYDREVASPKEARQSHSDMVFLKK
jgi:uncharacterized protein (DUF849 family)